MLFADKMRSNPFMATGSPAASLFLRALRLALLAACVTFAGACKKKEEEHKIFISFLEKDVMAAADGDSLVMSEEIRERIGEYGKHFDVIANYAKELNNINAWMAGEKKRFAAPGPVYMEKLGSERARIERAAGAFSRSERQIEAIRVKAENAKAALKQAENVREAFNRVYEKKIGAYAAACQSLYAAQKDFYAEALRMGIFLEKHKDKIMFKNKMALIDEQALAQEYNAMQKSLQEKFHKMQDVLSSSACMKR